MQRLLSSDEMRRADASTIESFGIPGRVLMETAGRIAAEVVGRRLPSPGRVVCLCGKGNNGGDGLVAARFLHDLGATVHVYMVLGRDGLSPDAEANYRVLRTLEAAAPEGTLKIGEGSPSPEDLEATDVIVDAMLGTGLKTSVREPIRSVIADVNRVDTPVVAVDIPSGLDSDHGSLLDEAVRADDTVTMAAVKTGLVINRGPDVSGRIHVANIGIPSSVLGDVQRETFDKFIPGPSDVTARLPLRPRVSHKYSAGLVTVVAGSPGLTGAPEMASLAAVRIGAGAAVCACPESVRDVLAAKFTEVMTLGLPTSDGGIDPERAAAPVQTQLRRSHALVIGCGLGRSLGTQEFVRRTLEHVDVPVVIDADGLNALNGHQRIIEERSDGRWILTPHPGEFARLTGVPVDSARVLEIASDHARRWNCVLILKGTPSVVADRDGAVFVNPTGNRALASAGTGDILAGMCGGLLAQGVTPLDAALLGLYLGGAAADRYASLYASESMLATDLLRQLPSILSRFRP
jgi:NAD(P)H-hydrate epimerase